MVSPALATAYVLTDSLASPQARNRAGNWVNSGYNAGGSAGSVLAGQLIGQIPLTACLPVLAAPALLAVLPLLRLRSTGAEEQPAPPGGLAGSAATPVAEAGDR
jgi:predicted MFS family arabinose efflux permease